MIETISGMRPTGSLHLGHYFGALKNWIPMQHEHSSLFFVADWHALTSDFENTDNIKNSVKEIVLDWLSAGLDPESCGIFLQSDVKQVAELHLLFSMITPLGWLERCPTYKEQQAQITNKDLGNYGFLGYPVLMSSDILLYRAKFVPVGIDQEPHLELTREIARRFNHIYKKNIFPEPQAKLTPTAKCPGLDGRKMSKSYNNGIYLKDTLEEISPKVRGMLTDENRVRKTDKGNPDVCNLFPYHLLMTAPEKCNEIREGCTTASMGCVDCKKIFLESISTFLAPIHEKRAEILAKPNYIDDVLSTGGRKAREEAEETMCLVRSAMRI